jgi:hypothetical protein
MLLTFQDPGDGFAPGVLASSEGYTLAVSKSRGRPGINAGRCRGVEPDRRVAFGERLTEPRAAAAPLREPLSLVVRERASVNKRCCSVRQSEQNRTL